MRWQEYLSITQGKMSSGYTIVFQRDGVEERFPEEDEPPIPTLLKAWEHAGHLASKTKGQCIFITVKEIMPGGQLQKLSDIVTPNL
jgi:hypothetical protein